MLIFVTNSWTDGKTDMLVEIVIYMLDSRIHLCHGKHLHINFAKLSGMYVCSVLERTGTEPMDTQMYRSKY